MALKKKKEEKLKYAKFAIELNRAISRKVLNVELDSFNGLEPILKTMLHRGLLRGFQCLSNGKVKLFLKFTPKLASPVLKKIELLTKSSLRAYRKSYELERLYFYKKSSFPRFFILSTQNGLTIFDQPVSKNFGGELIYQVN